MVTTSSSSSGTSGSISSESLGMKARRTISPYDLTAGDNPGTLISKPILVGHNYDEWSSNLRRALRARKKFGFVDGSLKQPSESSEEYEDWIANSALVVSWIHLTIEEKLCSSLLQTDDAHELWIHIQKRFGVKNGQRVQRLKSELANCNQKGVPVEEYYGKLIKLWTSLADYQKAKTAEEIQKEREEDKLHQFLMGLDDSIFGSVKSSLLSRETLPTVEEAYNVVCQDEESKQVGRMNEERHEGMSFAVQTSQLKHREVSDNRGRGPVVCKHCGRRGHVVENCFQKIGYPEWYPERTRNKFGNTSNGKFVPSSTLTTSKRHEPARANQVQTSPAGLFTSAANSQSHSDDRGGFTGLDEAQWAALVRMLDERKLPPNERLTGTFSLESWILDTGATNHMTGCLDFLSDIHDMAPMLIKLPDGRITTSTKNGRVQLGSSLGLQNVYFVDGLQCHLISVSQLTRESRCVLQISDTICVIQDRITKMLIGAGEQQNGLYFFRGLEVAAAAMKTTTLHSVEMWHSRLGHPSSKVMKMLPFSDFSISGFDNKACEICLRAKQTRDSFALSDNKSTVAFELVHCDLWGPYRTTAICGSKYFLTIVDDHSRAVWIYLMASKQEAPTYLKNFLSFVQR